MLETPKALNTSVKNISEKFNRYYNGQSAGNQIVNLIQ